MIFIYYLNYLLYNIMLKKQQIYNKSTSSLFLSHRNQQNVRISNKRQSNLKSSISWQIIKQKMKREQESKMRDFQLLVQGQKNKHLQKQMENIEAYVYKQLWGLDERICRDLCMTKFKIIEEQENKQQNKFKHTNIHANRSKYIR